MGEGEDSRTVSVDGELGLAGGTPRPGTLIGRFLAVEELGSGGMGVVLSAYDPQLDRRVALKLLRAAGNDAAAAALAREAQAMARLQHPNVVAVHEVGTVDGMPYMVLEQVKGHTLRGWLADEPRSWQAIVDLLIEAGEGLAAAHRAGIVHRDFKPENVLVDGDGRPRVADFGLASLARDGAVAGGTRGYMAPEQAAGESVDERADQYGFCVTAWEALHGERPAADAAPPRSRRAPLRVYRALARGLRARPQERWPSMSMLLAALRPPASRRPALWIAGAAALGIAAFAIGRREAATPACDDGTARIATIWDDASRAQVAAAFGRTGRPNADDTFARVDASLRARTATLARAHRDICEATHVRHEQSDTMLDLRMRCLEQARSEVRALVVALAAGGAATVDRAAQAAADVGDVAACSDVTALAAVVPPPRGEAAVEVDALREELARLTAMRTLGQWKEGLAAATETVARARRAGYAPTLAQALAALGWFGTATKLDVDAAIETLYEAARVAAEARDDVLAGEVQSYLVLALGDVKQRFEAANVAYQAATAASARAGNPPALLANLYTVRGHVLENQGDPLRALPLRILVLALQEQLHGVKSGQVAGALLYIGTALSDLGRPRDALGFYDRALAITAETAGPTHPRVAIGLFNIGISRLRAGDADGAAEALARSLANDERTYGPDSVQVADRTAALGEARYEQRRLPEARALLESARGLHTSRLGADHPKVALDDATLGEILRAQGDPVAAHAACQRAIASLGRDGAGPDPRVAVTERIDAIALLDLGRVAEARAAVERALAIQKQTIGENHPDGGDSLRVLADVLGAERRTAEALPLARRALALAERRTGGVGPGMVEPLLAVCAAALDSERGDEAAAAARRAVALASAAPEELRTRATLCLALSPAGDRVQARAARARLAALHLPERELSRIDRWLARR